MDVEVKMIPENGKFEFLGHVTIAASDTAVPLGTTHIVAVTGTTATDVVNEAGILAFKTATGQSLQVTVIPTGRFVRLYSNIIPGTGVLWTGTVGTVTSTITQVSFFRWLQ